MYGSQQQNIGFLQMTQSMLRSLSTKLLISCITVYRKGPSKSDTRISRQRSWTQKESSTLQHGNTTVSATRRNLTNWQTSRPENCGIINIMMTVVLCVCSGLILHKSWLDHLHVLDFQAFEVTALYNFMARRHEGPLFKHVIHWNPNDKTWNFMPASLDIS